MKVSFHHAKKVPKAILKKVWHRQYPHVKMPNVEMITQQPKDFVKQPAILKSKGLEDTSHREYGHKISPKSVRGLTFQTKSGKYVILGREDYPTVAVMKHEFAHIKKREV